MIDTLSNFEKLFRVKQWVKNLFIFFPLLFAGKFYLLPKLSACFIAFVGFCLVSSSVYILNDLIDIKADRLHPKKSKRPIAAGKIKKNTVLVLIGATMSAGLFTCYLADILVLYLAAVYLALHCAYNLATKKIIILDVISIAIGFQIRIWSGSVVAGVLPSIWLQLCVFLLSLFLGFTKRRYELSALRDKAAEHRNVLSHYTSYLLDQIIIISSTLTIVFYGLYTMSPDIIDRIGNENMVYSLIFVIYGIFRYLYLVHVKKLGDDPGDVIFSDIPLMINIILWIFFIIYVLYPVVVV